VPVHPVLIGMGLLQFLADRRKAGAGPLFPHLTPNKYGNLAWYPLKMFNESFLPKAIATTGRQSFYSFRHSFRDELRRIGAPPDALQALGGWSQGKLTSDDYGDKSNPDYQLNYVKQIAFPGLDLSHLYVEDDQ
jgi:integrase